MTFYVTFRTSSEYKDNFLRLEASSYFEAHGKIINKYPEDYSFVWNELQWIDYNGATIDKRFNLTEMKFEDNPSKEG